MLMRIAATVFMLACAASFAAERPPNVVLIFTDDQGFADVGCFGGKGLSTPSLDRMASEGTRFTNFHVAQAVCSASRAALLTGCYPNRIGIGGALSPSMKHGINADELTLAEMLKNRGYATAMYGKWHLGHHPQFLPMQHGFDDYFGLPYSNDMWPRHPSSKFPDLPLIERDKTIAGNPDQSQLTTWYTQRAVKFIEENKCTPFFLYLAHSMPHVPLFVSDKFKGKSQRGLYGDVIMELDWSVGQVLQTLKANGLDENTLVIFTSDNGPWLSYGNHAGSAGQFREGKGTAWEGGTRVPCIMRWPGKIPAGRECREALMTIDLLPTIARITKAELSKNKIDGLDVWPILAGEPGARNPHNAYFMFYQFTELHAVLSGKWKLVLPHSYRTLAGKPGGKDGKPANYAKAEAALSLYDLETDPGEATDVSVKNPEVVERLQNLAETCREDLGDSLLKRQGKNVRPPGRLAN